MRQRRETVEHPFGTIKSWMGATHFVMKRLENVRTEMALNVLAYNLTRTMNIIGIRPLMAAIQVWDAASAEFRAMLGSNRRLGALKHSRRVHTPKYGKSLSIRQIAGAIWIRASLRKTAERFHTPKTQTSHSTDVVQCFRCCAGGAPGS